MALRLFAPLPGRWPAPRRCTLRTVVNYCLAGEFPGAFKISGALNSPWHIPQSAFDTYLEKQRGQVPLAAL